MDFLDPKKLRRHKINLRIGYSLTAIAIFLMTVVLLFLAFGYGLGKNGQIIQNGLVFVSSKPNPAQIYLNGIFSGSNTDARLQLAAGQYTLEIKLAGYRTWVRPVGVEGGSVEHFDYPLLFPTKLVTTDIAQYSSQPAIVTQSPSLQWLLIQIPGSNTDFDEYDLSNPKQLSSTLTTVSIPTSILPTATGSQSLSVVGWSGDNTHLLLLDSYSGGSDYILLDRQTPADSIDLTKTLKLSSTMQLSYDNEKYDQYYVYDSSDQTLSTDTLSSIQLTPLLTGVLSYITSGSNSVLYTTPSHAISGNVDVELYQSGHSYDLRSFVPGTQILIELAQYSGNWYVALGATNLGKIYIYENPASTIQSQPTLPLVPAYILKVSNPDYLAFSQNSQFVVAEGSQSFATYDADNQKGYAYNLNEPISAGQHATWMDGDRLILTTNQQAVVFDYDGANQQTLQVAIDGSIPFFDPAYGWIYSLANGTPSPTDPQPVSLTSTTLTAP